MDVGTVASWLLALVVLTFLWALILAPSLEAIHSGSRTATFVGMVWLFAGTVFLWEGFIRDRVL